MVARSKFYEMDDVSVFDLQLDSHNPRIRHGVDQNDCIARIVKDRETFLHLMRDIATNGLSPAHVLLSKNSEGKLVVRDGNRRVTALKLLNRPDMCLPDEALRNIVQRIANSAATPIVDQINCLACDDEATILDYLRRLHTGENSGIGQVGWSALLISLFNTYTGAPDQNRRAAQLILWMEDQGMVVPNEFPITTLTRLLNIDSLATIGFAVVNEQLAPMLPVAASYALASRVINDIASKAINVTREGGAGSVFTPEDAAAYIRRVRQEVGPAEPRPTTGDGVIPPGPDDSPVGAPAGGSGGAAPAAPESGGGSQAGGGSTEPVGGAPDRGGAPAGGAAMPADGRPGSSTTVKPAWDRPCLFGRRKNSKADFAFPTNRAKLMNLVSELRQLDPNKTPMAVNMLLRGLLELSDGAYRTAYSLRDLNGLHKNIASSADKMLNDGLLTTAEHHVIQTYTRSEQSIMHVRSIQKNIHDDTYHPNGQNLNTMWDSIGCFVRACWVGVMHAET